MPQTAQKTLFLSRELGAEIEAQWTDALSYFRSRGKVIFLSNCRFWEQHAFVQQSLAYHLAQGGVEVLWLDGAGWRPYRPLIGAKSPLLTVRQLPQLPGRRFPWIGSYSVKMTVRLLKSLLRKDHGQRPIVWVQSGFDENVISELPYVDLYSTFDDPYQHAPLGPLCEKSRVVLCQNSLCHRMMSGLIGDKAKLALPPLDLGPDVYRDPTPIRFPPGFPTRRMGYIGSFFSTGFDLVLFENFIRSYPDWGFLLMGRTDKEGFTQVERFKRYPNFLFLPWAPRAETAGAWASINVSLLLYRTLRTQDGAFAVKAVESLHFGAPSVGTQVPKTEDVGSYFPMSPFVETIKRNALDTAAVGSERITRAHEFFAFETHPRLYLARAAQWLRGRQTTPVPKAA